MNNSPKSTDIIELCVCPDGTILLIKRTQKPFGMIAVLTYTSGIDEEMEALAAELYSYGASKSAIKRAILDVSFAPYNDEIIL